MSDTNRLATLLSIEDSHAKLQTDNFALNQRIAELEGELRDYEIASDEYEATRVLNVVLKKENERLENGECLVKLHNALLLEGEKTKALLRQTEELKAENERLRVVIDRLEKDYKPAFVDAERWRETMLEWGDGVVNGFGDFWNRISAQMTREEQQAAIDAAKNCD